MVGDLSRRLLVQFGVDRLVQQRPQKSHERGISRA
jgi:hypothetical protein